MTQDVAATRVWAEDNDPAEVDTESSPLAVLYLTSTPSGKHFKLTVANGGTLTYTLLVPNAPTDVNAHQ